MIVEVWILLFCIQVFSSKLAKAVAAREATKIKIGWLIILLIGKYKKLPNEVGGMATCSPESVQQEMEKLILNYNKIENKTIETIIQFHKNFEEIHPFQDGNGRVGRLIMFKECLNNNIVPFIIDEEHKLYYYRGLKEWENEKGYLIETCLSCQDKYKLWLDYFKIKY